MNEINETNERIKVLMPTEVPDVHKFADFKAINERLDEYVASILPKINTEDLSGWKLSLYVNSVCTDFVAIYKRFRRYPSDREYEISIGIPIPNETQANYGMPIPTDETKIPVYYPPYPKNNHLLKPEYEKYDSLEEFIFKAAIKAINFGFTKGFTCYGKKIKFQNL